MFYARLMFIVVVIFLSYDVICAPTKYAEVPSTEMLKFMKKFGYIEEDDGNSEALYTEEGISDIIKTVQRYGAIEETGKIDNATKKLLTAPRCGVPDIIKNKRHKRYVLGPNNAGWQKRNITYFLANWTPQLGEYTVVKNIQKALDAWGRYGRLNFRRVSDPNADIIVAFGSGYHGDRFVFDGPGNILAHAFFPYEYSDLGGDIHFDNDETWIDIKQNPSAHGTDFYTVALHELGHSLGLSHSPDPTAVMFAYYKGHEGNNEPQLSHDDIMGMYMLYIVRNLKGDYEETTVNNRKVQRIFTTTTTTTEPTFYSRKTESSRPEYTTPYTTTSTTKSFYHTSVTYEGDDESVEKHKNHDDKHKIPAINSPSLPNICDGFVDAIATLRSELFVFKDQFIWRFKDKGKLEKGYPVPLRQMFPGLPNNVKKVDAAYQRPDGTIVIFSGKFFWVHDGHNFTQNSPRLLTDYGLPEYLTNIDAVQTWGRNGKTYFYRKERFWRYNENTRSMDHGYPLHMERWRGVPENLDAATTWNDGVTYFFKGELFWTFDNDWVITTDGSPFPTAQLWFGCSEEPYKMMRLFN